MSVQLLPTNRPASQAISKEGRKRRVVAEAGAAGGRLTSAKCSTTKCATRFSSTTTYSEYKYLYIVGKRECFSIDARACSQFAG